MNREVCWMKWLRLNLSRSVVRYIVENRRGMTLTEVIVSMTLITMMLTMLSTVLMTGMRCQQHMVITSEMRKISDLVLYQLTQTVGADGMMAEIDSWIGRTVHDDYEVEQIELIQEFFETPEMVRIDLTLTHIKTGTQYHSFGYVHVEDDLVPDEETLYDDLFETGG